MIIWDHLIIRKMVADDPPNNCTYRRSYKAHHVFENLFGVIFLSFFLYEAGNWISDT